MTKINETSSYIIGLLQTDGHRSISIKNKSTYKGNISIELSKRDEDILNKMSIILGPRSKLSSRSRITNYTNGKIHHSSSLRICGTYVDDDIVSNIPIGKKSKIIKPPITEYSEKDYWRGIIDDDGSLGFRLSEGREVPFISLATASEDLYIAYKKYINNIINLDINCKRNKRDYIYNIMVVGENCKKLISELYYNNCLSIERKIKISIDIKNWKSPDLNKLYFTIADDQIILLHNNNNNEAALLLSKNVKSIYNRRKRLQLQ